MRAESSAVRSVLEELGPLDPHSLQIVALLFGEPRGVQADVVLVCEDQIVGGHLGAVEILPRLQGAHDVGRQCPCARVVGLVLIEGHVASLEVDVAEAKGRLLFAAHPLAAQHSHEEPTHDGDRGPVLTHTGHVLRVLVGEHPLHRFRLPEAWKPPTGDGVLSAKARRVDGKREDPPHDLAHVPPRRRRLARVDVRHHEVRMVERDFVDPQVPDVRVDVPLQVAGVHGPVLHGHMVGKLLRELAVRPRLREVLERQNLGGALRRCADAHGIDADHGGVPRAPRASERGHIEGADRFVALAHETKSDRDLRQGRASRERLLLSQARVKAAAMPVLPLDADAGFEAVGKAA